MVEDKTKGGLLTVEMRVVAGSLESMQRQFVAVSAFTRKEINIMKTCRASNHKRWFVNQ